MELERERAVGDTMFPRGEGYQGRDTVITYLDISLFESPAQTLVNTVNTVGVMGKGIAKIFKELYPEMFRKYRLLCQGKKLDIGKLYVYRTENKIVVNFPTKKHWRNPSRVSYIEAGLKKFVATYQEYGISSVSFPQLGCGHGELDWETDVQPLMEHYLRPLPIPVYIHLYSKSPDFVPERLDSSFARELQLERQRVSADQVWNDLHHLIMDSSEENYRIDMFTSANIDDERIYFTFADEKAIVFREDLEDLWNVLRLRGTIRESDVPQQIVDQQIRDLSVSSCLFQLLSRLEYVKPISLGLRRNGEIFREQGLQYAPSPKDNVFLDGEILI